MSYSARQSSCDTLVPAAWQLLESFKHKYPEVPWDDDPKLALPKRGNLDLEMIKESTYFFA